MERNDSSTCICKDKHPKKPSILKKTWERCRSMTTVRSRPPHPPITKAKSWPRGLVAPEGCFYVYVGPERERFVVKTQYLKHPLLRMLLDEAESEYGYSAGGPLELPCDLMRFERVLWEVERDTAQGKADVDDVEGPTRAVCNFPLGYQLLSPARPGMKLRLMLSPANPALTNRFKIAAMHA